MPPNQATAGKLLTVRQLGVVPYGEALDLQRALAEQRIRDEIPDTLLLLEHPPVVTLGRGWKSTSLPLPLEALERRGIEVFEIERGGDVTYHGPGQLVGYPILHLEQHRPDLHWYLRQIEETLIVALGALGISAERNQGYTGVWTKGRKIASIGIHVKQWVTWHGFALNVTTDLSPFELIVPCGIPNVEMTSIAKETGTAGVDMIGTARRAVVAAFQEVFGYVEIGNG
ncbi:MAG TPA: lipoyl(octanoyl) transferase LipB [Gemmatimonadales bacterium]|nr:lipoyl(octanoyl) transferase LipB [Gemmatimonadales bacterium]